MEGDFLCRASRGGHSKSLKRFGMIQGYLSLRLCVFYYVLLEHDGLPHNPMVFLLLSTWNDLGHLPDTQG